jgi:hypothetical protein
MDPEAIAEIQICMPSTLTKTYTNKNILQLTGTQVARDVELLIDRWTVLISKYKRLRTELND